MKILIVKNQKGGVGKSIFAYNGAHVLAKLGRVFFLELDEQGNSTKSLAPYVVQGIAASQFFGNEPVSLPRLPQQIIAVQGDMGLREIETSQNDAQLVKNLKQRLAEISQDFDFCIIDTPGANNKAANAGLVVSNYVVIPSKLDTYSLDVTSKELKRVIGVQQSINPTLVNLGILINEFDATSPTQKKDLEELLSKYHNYVIKGKISKKSAYREASGLQIPVWELDKTAGREAGKEIRSVFALITEKMGV